MQSIAVLGLVAGRVATARACPSPERPLFQSVSLPRHSCWRGLLLSVVLHGAGIWGLPGLMDMLPESDAAAWKRHMRAMRPLGSAYLIVCTSPQRPRNPPSPSSLGPRRPKPPLPRR